MSQRGPQLDVGNQLPETVLADAIVGQHHLCEAAGQSLLIR
jgi:hypothetical protein